MRVGIGYDVHPIVKGRKLFLGGIEIPSDFGLYGHSDADVLIHAISDAILGAVGLPDIGYFFPNTPEYKDISSCVILEEVKKKIVKEYTIINIDSVIIAEKPKISPYVDMMKERLASILEINPRAIGIKATTNERLGFIGREEGIVAIAVALVDERRI
ncbi:MAG: 2-C-methyl-D-erythritol 2,4-cyclodiphosphate synthase [bacterium]|nr:2-C-methyl-D-erythritol 2,4-cyclodiphosphate synthase [bacterium]